MKYCLNSQVSFNYLKKADQIKIDPEHFYDIPRLLETFPEKEFIIQFYGPPTPEELHNLNKYKALNSNIILSLPFFPDEELRNLFPYYTSYPVESFSEARALIANESRSIKIAGPLFFQLDNLKTLDTQVRLTPNRSWLSAVPRDNGIKGQWIRPEDIHLYDALPNAIAEFDLCSASEEEALYRIYAEEERWPGGLYFIVPDINSPILNRLLPDEIGTSRLNCGQKCMTTQHCRICENSFRIAGMVEQTYLQEI